MKILISPSGEIEISVIGAQGKECLDISKFLEKSLGEVIKRNFKPEYYQEVQVRPECNTKYLN